MRVYCPTIEPHETEAQLRSSVNNKDTIVTSGWVVLFSAKISAKIDEI